MENTTVMSINHVVKTPGICGGSARIDGTRLTVRSLVSQVLIQRYAVESIIDGYDHLDLSQAQVYAALAYYYDHQAEIDAEIAEQQAIVDEALSDKS